MFENRRAPAHQLGMHLHRAASIKGCICQNLVSCMVLLSISQALKRALPMLGGNAASSKHVSNQCVVHIDTAKNTTTMCVWCAYMHSIPFGYRCLYSWTVAFIFGLPARRSSCFQTNTGGKFNIRNTSIACTLCEFEPRAVGPVFFLHQLVISVR